MAMRETSWSKRALRAAGVGLVTLALAGPAAAEEVSERPAAALDAERPAKDGQEIGEASSESPSLPTPAHDVELPPPADGLPEELVEGVVIQDQIFITFAPRPLRRPSFRP
jgi:hypothetical protein